MSIPAFKLCTYWGASQAEMERRTLTPEDEAILGARWNRAQIHHDARKEEDRIKRDRAHAERRGRSWAAQVVFQVQRATADGKEQTRTPSMPRPD